jgi:hypothetical protein
MQATFSKAFGYSRATAAKRAGALRGALRAQPCLLCPPLFPPLLLRTGHKLLADANSRQRYFAGGCAPGISCLHCCLCVAKSQAQVATSTGSLSSFSLASKSRASHPPAKYLCLLLAMQRNLCPVRRSKGGKRGA